MTANRYPIVQEDIEEFKKIRKEFGATRPQFAKIFLGVSTNMVFLYENGLVGISEPIMRTARSWYNFLKMMRGEK